MDNGEVVFRISAARWWGEPFNPTKGKESIGCEEVWSLFPASLDLCNQGKLCHMVWKRTGNLIQLTVEISAFIFNHLCELTDSAYNEIWFVGGLGQVSWHSFAAEH